MIKKPATSSAVDLAKTAKKERKEKKQNGLIATC